MATDGPPAEPNESMKIIFAGTPDFAAVALERLIEAGHDVLQRTIFLPEIPIRHEAHGFAREASCPKARH